jgi:hypothetical protein
MEILVEVMVALAVTTVLHIMVQEAALEDILGMAELEEQIMGLVVQVLVALAAAVVVVALTKDTEVVVLD